MNLPFSQRRPEPNGPGPEFDARPLVAIQRRDRSAWWFAGGTAIAAVLLFAALEARRQGQQQAEPAGTTTLLAAPESIPELVIPVWTSDQPAAPASPWLQPGQARQASAAPAPVPRVPPMPVRPDYGPPPVYAQNPYPELPPPPPLADGPNGVALADGARPPAGPAGASTGRIMAGRLDHPATTVIQGTLINAVLETALDSTSPGQARAVVTRDVHGFDGTKVLIPRGSRLYGAYEANVAQGQKRAQIRWTRLLRPDGVSVALDSLAADPLGRAGVAARVNNHFFQRLGNALIGTTANVGSALVTRSVAPSSPVVVAVPGATQSASQVVTPPAGQIVPTLTVRQGTRITVFVQHDLDFTSVDAGP